MRGRHAERPPRHRARPADRAGDRASPPRAHPSREPPRRGRDLHDDARRAAPGRADRTGPGLRRPPGARRLGLTDASGPLRSRRPSAPRRGDTAPPRRPLPSGGPSRTPAGVSPRRATVRCAKPSETVSASALRPGPGRPVQPHPPPNGFSLQATQGALAMSFTPNPPPPRRRVLRAGHLLGAVFAVLGVMAIGAPLAGAAVPGPAVRLRRDVPLQRRLAGVHRRRPLLGRQRQRSVPHRRRPRRARAASSRPPGRVTSRPRSRPRPSSARRTPTAPTSSTPPTCRARAAVRCA